MDGLFDGLVVQAIDHEASIGIPSRISVATIPSIGAVALLLSVALLMSVTLLDSFTTLDPSPLFKPVTTLRALIVAIVAAIVVSTSRVLLVSMTAMSIVTMVVSAMSTGVLAMMSVPLAGMPSITTRFAQRTVANPVVATFDAIADAIELVREGVFAARRCDEGKEIELCVDRAPASIETCVEATCLAQVLSRLLLSDVAVSIVAVMRDRRRSERERGGDQTAQDDSLVKALSSVLRLHRIDLHACWVEDFVLLGRDLPDLNAFRPTGGSGRIVAGALCVRTQECRDAESFGGTAWIPVPRLCARCTQGRS